jgi:nicotinamide mononucleotide (NMN) deamidase PncC
MAKGALERSPADIAVAITGVAGPDPDEDGNPVGRVCIGLAQARDAQPFEFRYENRGRVEIQACAMADALRLLISFLKTIHKR